MKRNLALRILSVLLCAVLLGTGLPVQASEVTDQVIDENTEESEDVVTPEEPEIPEEPARDPLKIKVKRISTTRVRITWNGYEGLAYRIMRAVKSDGIFEEIAVVAGEDGDMTYIDKERVLGTLYTYKVEALEEEKIAETSNSVNVRIRLLPAENVTTTLTGNNDVEITWDKVQYASGYYVSRSTSKNGFHLRKGGNLR